METRITALRMIQPYAGPQWLIEPNPHAERLTDDALGAEFDALAEMGCTGPHVRDDAIMGWDDYTAVVAYVREDGSTLYYLARIDA